MNTINATINKYKNDHIKMYNIIQIIYNLPVTYGGLNYDFELFCKYKYRD